VKTQLSKFLRENKKRLHGLVKDLTKEFSYVSLLGTDTIGKVYNVTRTGSAVQDSAWTERGFVIRVFNGVNYSEYSFNSLEDPECIMDQVRHVAKRDINELLKQGVTMMPFPLLEENDLKDEFHSECQIDPFQIPAETKLARMTELMQYGLAKSEHFVDFRVNFEEVLISKVFVSDKKDLAQSILFTNLAFIGIGRKDGKVRYAFESLSGLKGYEIFEGSLPKIDLAAKNVIELFDAERIIPGTYDIICDPAVAGLIAHEAFGHGVEMDMFVKHRAKGEEFIGKRIASEKVNMHDGALSAEEVGTYLFDDEGTTGTDTVIIDKSILKSGISDLLSAIKLGTSPTGNGRRESFERKAYARMTNTFFESGDDTLEDMIKSIQKGYLLEGYYSGMEDPKNWGIQCMIAKGREIIAGKLTGKIVSPVVLTGYVPDLLESISMVSENKITLSGTGYCGKGYKEHVKVSTGGTYIKAVGRLG